MTFSVELIDLFKQKRGLTSDNKAAAEIPAMNSGNLSKIRNGADGRHLNEEQALFIAHECGLNPEWVLVHLAEEKAKSEEAKDIWCKLAKKISRSATAALLAVIVIFSGLDSKQPDSAVFA